MASDCFILANDNIFNKAVLNEAAYYYKDEQEVTALLNRIDEIADKDKANFVATNLEVIRTQYSWEHLVDEHEKYFYWLLEQKRK
jgi:hypothetical protein